MEGFQKNINNYNYAYSVQCMYLLQNIDQINAGVSNFLK